MFKGSVLRVLITFLVNLHPNNPVICNTCLQIFPKNVKESTQWKRGVIWEGIFFFKSENQSFILLECQQQ